MEVAIVYMLVLLSILSVYSRQTPDNIPVFVELDIGNVSGSVNTFLFSCESLKFDH